MANSKRAARVQDRKRYLRLIKHRNFTNSVFGVADYLVLPALMIVAAPILVHRLGLEQFGLWMLITSIISSGGLIGSGFGDAAVHYISTYRGRGDSAGVERTLHSMLWINAVLGATLAIFLWIVTPIAVGSLFKISGNLHVPAETALHFGAIALSLKCIENVFSGCLRALEKYRPTANINIVTRTVTVVSALALSLSGFGVVAIVAAATFANALGLTLHALWVRRTLALRTICPRLHRDSLAEVARFGSFSWLQALAGVAFNHADRLLIGAYLGAGAVGIYSICAQAAQVIHGVVASGSHFMFPHLAAHNGSGDVIGAERRFRIGLVFNLLAAVGLASMFVIFSHRLLSLWMGPEFALQGTVVLRALAVAYGMLAMNVVSHYALLAVGEVRFVSLLNVTSGIAGLATSVFLIPSLGMIGAATGRMVQGLITWVNFWRVHSYFVDRKGPMPQEEIRQLETRIGMS
ncbi:MAG TPA: oligosaccharide flippase family protein [Terriglobales bacterium]|nr:oligosaccharide flippase family protein [Terriglobales bacterium]